MAMGLCEDASSREGLLASMEDVASKQFIFARNLSVPIIDRFGREGLEILKQGFRKFGIWRGENIRIAPAVVIGSIDAFTVLDNWDSCDFFLFARSGRRIEIDGNGSVATISVPAVLGFEYFREHGSTDLLQEYWVETFRGIGEGIGKGCHIESILGESGSPWRIKATCPRDQSIGEPNRKREIIEDILSDPQRAVTLIRQSSRNAGALYMFIAREVIRAYDATGEQLIREGVRGIGRERGSIIRDRHLAEGRNLNLKSLMLDWDGPLVSTWVFNEGGSLSEGKWHQDCIYCPYADVWAEYGAEGLALGYLYDIELHTTMYQTYHPGVVVRWEALKTRGDHMCKFRFSIPELSEQGK